LVIIEADTIINDGANECLIRAVFYEALALCYTENWCARADQVPDNTVNPVGGPCENLSILIIQNFIQHLS
jgi:hypothetical protein